MKKVLSLCLMLSMVFFIVSFASAGDDGVKGANAGAADCTKKCLEKGAKMVVVTDGDQKILAVENPDALKGHEGHHVAVSGHVTGDSLHVMSVKML